MTVRRDASSVMAQDMVTLRIEKTERKRSSRWGNPRLKVTTDRGVFLTSPDSTIANVIENSMFRVGLIIVTLDDKGEIVRANPVRTGQRCTCDKPHRLPGRDESHFPECPSIHHDAS